MIILPKFLLTYTITSLEEGTLYKISVRSVGVTTSDPVTSNFPTDPDSVKDLIINQNVDHPTRQLDLKWVKPQGNGENILIIYQGSHTDQKQVVDASFIATSTSINVVPGNNYTVTVIAQSNGLNSTEVVKELNSKPSEPQFMMTTGVTYLALSWDPPCGYVETFIILQETTGCETIPGDRITYTIDRNIDPYTEYTVTMYSVITNISGMVEESARRTRNKRTLVGIQATDIGLIVGLVVACVVIVCLVGIAFYLYRRNKKSDKKIPNQTVQALFVKSLPGQHRLENQSMGAITSPTMDERSYYQ